MTTLAASFTELRAAAYRRGMGAEFDRANRFSVKAEAEGAGKAAPKKSAAIEPKPKAKRSMNTWERKYAEHLEQQRLAGLVAWYGFERVRLRLGNGAWFKPDFIIVMASGAVEFHEVKGHMRAAAHVRLKVAADQYPFRFFVVRPAGGTNWGMQEVAK